MELDLSPAPYPGLRTFEQSESDIFFGRDELVDAMLGKLEKAHFLCVTGTSGSGKSSLVRTGLFNALLAGYLPGTGSDWVICDMRPGEAPLRRLVDALARAVLRDPYAENGNVPDPAEVETLATGFESYIDEVSSDLNPALDELADLGDRPVIILADQFEELHRYSQKDRHATARFVDVLLKTARAAGRVYVVITVRHEELARCARFPGLNRAINASQFLTPALDRYQMQEAIEGPIRLFGGEIDPRLTVRMLNDLESEMDKLPLMQHALKMLYERRRSRQPLVIGVEDFNEIFELASDRGFDGDTSRHALRRAMSNRLDRIYHRLPADLQVVTPRAFSALTNMTSEGRDIRNPVNLDQLARIIDRPVEDTIDLIEAFIEGEDGYLRASGPLTAEENPEIDVRHECVLRIWERLQEEWLPGEARNAQMFKDLARRARGWDGGRSLWRRLRDDTLLRGTGLKQYDGWWKEHAPNRAWAQRHLSEVNAEGKAGRPREEVSDNVTYGHTKAFLRVSHQAKSNRDVLSWGTLAAVMLMSLGGFLAVQADRTRTQVAAAKRTAEAEAMRVVDAIVPGESDKSPALTIRTAVEAIQSVKALDLAESDIRNAMYKLWRADFHAFERRRYRHLPTAGGSEADAEVYGADFVGGDDRVVTLTQAAILHIWERGDTGGSLGTYDVAGKLGLKGHLGRSMRVAPNGRVAAVGTDKGALAFVDLNSGAMQQPQDRFEADSGALLNLAFSADGKYLATASWEGAMVRLYEHRGPGPLDWRAHSRMTFSTRVYSVALNEEGSVLASGLSNGQVCIGHRQFADVSPICSGEGHLPGQPVKALAFHPKEDLLVSAGSDDRAVIWSVLPLKTAGAGASDPDAPRRSHVVATGVNLWHDSDIWDIAFDPKGETMATMSWDGSMRLFEAGHWQPLGLMRGHEQAGRTVVFDSTGQYLLSGALDNSARLWSPFASLAADDGFSRRFASVHSNGSPRSILDLAFGPEAAWVALTDGREVLIKTATSPPEPLGVQPDKAGAPAQFTRLAVGGDTQQGAIIAAAQTVEGVHLWARQAPDGPFRDSRMTFAFGDAAATELATRPVAVSPDGSRLAVGIGAGDDFSVAVCPNDSLQGDVICERGAPDVRHLPLPALAGLPGTCDLEKPEPTALDFSPDGNRLAVGLRDCSLRIYDLTTDPAGVTERVGHTEPVTSVDFGADELIISGSADDTGRIWPADGGRALILAGGHSMDVTDVHLAPDGKTAITVSMDESLAIWDVEPMAGAPARSGDDGPVANLRSVLPGHTSRINTLDMIQIANGRMLMATGTEGGKLLVMPYFEMAEALRDFSQRNLEPILGREATALLPRDLAAVKIDLGAGQD